MRLPVGQRSFCRRAGWLAESGDPSHEHKLHGWRMVLAAPNGRHREDGGHGLDASDRVSD